MSDELHPTTMLTPRDCADLLSVSPDYIIGEIRDGRLPARVRQYASGRKRYRVRPDHFTAYVEEYWPAKGQPKTKAG